VRPNPFRAGESVLVSLALPRAAAADLRIYDVQGRLVRTLIARELGAGSHVASWDGTRESGGPAPAGVYFVRLRAGEAESRRKVVMIR
jgi:flagellar hook assembly protein FlgD